MSIKISDANTLAIPEFLSFGIKQKLYDTDTASVYVGKNPALCLVKMANED